MAGLQVIYRMPKKYVAFLFYKLGLSQTVYSLHRRLRKGEYVRAVNYHGTPQEHAKEFEQQLKYYRDTYSPASGADLTQFFRTGKWHKSRPGLIICFDDGLRNNFDVALPLLERYGFTGWFFIPVQFCQTPPERQVEFAGGHRISVSSSSKTARVAMSAEELQFLAKSHMVGSHTVTHCRFWSDIGSSQLQSEIKDSKLELEGIIGKPVKSFAWVGGESATYHDNAMELIAETGYQFCFNTISSAITSHSRPLMLGRTNIEAWWPMDVVLFQLSGLMDMFYLPKKKMIYHLLNQGIAGSLFNSLG